MTLNHPLKIIFIGCVESSATLLNTLLSECQAFANVVGIVSKSSSDFNADHVNLIPVAQRYHVSYLDYTGNQSELLDFIKDSKADVCYCFGWSQLLPEKILNVTKYGVIGFHPSKLPENRGRHPIIWPLVLGMNETASSFFQMDEGADSGPLLSQESINISQNDDAQSLYDKVLDVAQEQVKIFTQALAQNTAQFLPQDHSKATYWRKRTAKDGLIDWRMLSQDIVNLVRGLAKPYVGAEFMHKNTVVKVWQSQIAEGTYNKATIPGTVLAVEVQDSLLLVTAKWCV